MRRLQIAKYETDAASEKIEQGGTGWWHNWQGGRPPPIHPYLFDDFCYNEFVIQVVSAAIKDVMPPDWDGALSGGYGLINMAYRGVHPLAVRLAIDWHKQKAHG